MTRIDSVTERASRWLAARTTRRGFLATSAKVAVVGATGISLAQILEQRAEARVCGQSGISPKCPTYDCVGPNVQWGWCWYASPGCCANGGLKKICDCCGANYPNVHGYCPEGSNVYCVVESCLEDPRLQKVALERYVGAGMADLSLARLAQRPVGSATSVVVAAADVLVAAIAVPVAAELGAPLLLIDPNGPSVAAVNELRRVGPTMLIVVGTGLSSAAFDALAAVATVERLTAANDVAVASVELAGWYQRRTGRGALVCIGAGASAQSLASSAAAHAAALRRPLVIGVDAVGASRANSGERAAVLLIGDEVVARAGDVASSTSVPGNDPVAISVFLADRTIESVEAARVHVSFVAASSSPFAFGLLPSGGVVIVHEDGHISDSLREWLISRRPRFAGADLVASGAGAVADRGVYELQSALNGFDAHLLTGVDGMGLPVYALPLDERPIGNVRVTGELPPTTTPLVTRAARRLGGPTTTVAVRVASPVTSAPRSAPPSP